MPENEDQLLREQIRGAHEDRDRSRRKLTRKRERQSVESSGSGQGNARVIATEGGFFILRSLDENKKEETIRAKTYKGTHSSNPNSTLVAVGDEVRINLIPSSDQGGVEGKSPYCMIEEVLPRRTKLSRRAAGRGRAFEQVIVANVDVLVIVASVREPKLRSGIIDRYIVAALEGGLSVVITINKADLASGDEMEEAMYFRDLYREIGYPVLLLSATSGAGICDLKDEIAGTTSVFAGHSGVGKSSLVNAILGRLREGVAAQRTGVLQKKFRRGAHTTASTTLLAVQDIPETYIADTPGVREFSNFELRSADLKFAFVEFLPFQEHCAMPNCSHLHEPGCAVRQAVEDDKISIDRYSSYEKLFEEAKSEETKRIHNQ